MINKPIPPIKSLGQNFLIHTGIAEQMVEACALDTEETVLEIGPGKGAITTLLSEQCNKVIAVEKDHRLANYLLENIQNEKITVIHEDFLKYSIDDIPGKLKVVGNLPYNAATPIIEKLIECRKKIKSIFITVQLEYGQRIAADVNTKNYGSFSCFVQYYTRPKILFRIKNSAFDPIPKVQSCFMRLDILKTPEYPADDEVQLFRIIRACFSQRRKTIHNSLAVALSKDRAAMILKELNIDPKLRAENLTLKDFTAIANLSGGN